MKNIQFKHLHDWDTYQSDLHICHKVFPLLWLSVVCENLYKHDFS